MFIEKVEISKELDLSVSHILVIRRKYSAFLRKEDSEILNNILVNFAKLELNIMKYKN